MKQRLLAVLVFCMLSGLPCMEQAICTAGVWQYYVPFETGRVDKDGQRHIGKAYIWLPPESQGIRGLLVGGRLGIELEMAIDQQVRRACSDNDIAIVYFSPHISAVFHYWEQGDTSTDRWLKALADLARRTGHLELRRVPWIPMGHSTAGIFCRNVAYWKPERVAGVIHIKSGNYHQQEHLPPAGSLAGVPVLNISGQFEVYGPEGGIRPEYGRETQWVFVRKDILRFKQDNPNHLMSLLLHRGADHFHGSPELAAHAAMFIAKTAKYRIGELPRDRDERVVLCTSLGAEDGWLTDSDLYDPAAAPAPYADYTGDKLTAMWHYDGQTAQAVFEHHRNLSRHQALGKPECTWLDEADGWTFRVAADFLDQMPGEYGGRIGRRQIGHAEGPVVFRCKQSEPVVQIGPDTFRLLRAARHVHVCAFHPGDEEFRATSRWSKLRVPVVKGERQMLHFPALEDIAPNNVPVKLNAVATSGLPVYYEVEYGPVVFADGGLVLCDMPHDPQFPIECRVTAYQLGRRIAPAIRPAEPVSRTFRLIGP